MDDEEVISNFLKRCHHNFISLCHRYFLFTGAWVDPSTYIKDSYPWSQPPSTVAQLRQISAEDVGLESDPPDENETQDPLVSI